MKIAIIGAGISGLTLANLIYLGESNKINFKIFEKNSVIDNEETGIQLLPNATRILNLIGLNKIDSKSFFSPNSINFMDITNGKNISKIDLSNLTSDYSPYFCLKRSTLKKFLLKQLPENSVVFNKKTTSISATSYSSSCNCKCWDFCFFNFIHSYDALSHSCKTSYSSMNINP